MYGYRIFLADGSILENQETHLTKDIIKWTVQELLWFMAQSPRKVIFHEHVEVAYFSDLSDPTTETSICTIKGFKWEANDIMIVTIHANGNYWQDCSRTCHISTHQNGWNKHYGKDSE